MSYLISLFSLQRKKSLVKLRCSFCMRPVQPQKQNFVPRVVQMSLEVLILSDKMAATLSSVWTFPQLKNLGSELSPEEPSLSGCGQMSAIA